MNTSSLILLASLTLVGTTIASESMKRGKHPSYLRTVLASAAVGVFLSMIAAGSDSIARAMAWLVIAGSITINGAPLIKSIGNLGK